MTAKTTRDALAAAFAEAEGDETETGPDVGSAVDEPDGDEGESSGAEGAKGDAAAEIESDEEEGDASEGGRKRGADGKFVAADADEPKPKLVTEAKPDVAAATAAAAAAVAATSAASQQPALKPPADWRPAAKEAWAKLPRVVQEEALRLHVETKKVLDQGAQARQVAGAFQQTVQPYEHMFRALGRSPLEGVGYLLQSYAQLQTAPLPQRAALLGGLVRDFLGTDEAAINLLAQVLEGKPPQGGAGAAPGFRPEQIPQLVRQEAQRMAAESAQQAAAKTIQDFEASEPEFLSSVLPQMKAIVGVALQEGKPITAELLKSAHQQALRLNPETAAILKQRDDAAAAKKRQEDTGKRRAAASGIKHEPGGPGAGGSSAKAKSTREELSRQFTRAEGKDRV